MMSRDPIESDLLIAGSVERVRDYYVEQARRGIANYFMLMLPFGDMSDEEASRTLEGFIDEVIPAVREVEVARPERLTRYSQDRSALPEEENVVVSDTRNPPLHLLRRTRPGGLRLPHRRARAPAAEANGAIRRHASRSITSTTATPKVTRGRC